MADPNLKQPGHPSRERALDELARGRATSARNRATRKAERDRGAATADPRELERGASGGEPSGGGEPGGRGSGSGREPERGRGERSGLFGNWFTGSGERSKRAEKTTHLDLTPGDEILHSIFLALAIGPNFGWGPLGAHWEISPNDAKRLNAAWSNFARHFSPEVTQRTADTIILCKVAGGIVAPRVLQTIMNRPAPSVPQAAQAPVPPAATRAAPQPAGSRSNGASPVWPAGAAQTPSQADPAAMAMSHATA